MDFSTKPQRLKILKEEYYSNLQLDELQEFSGMIRPKNYRLIEPKLYLKCQWSEKTSLWFMVYRWVHMVVLLICLVLSLVYCPLEYALKCYIYMTTWAQFFFLYQAAFGASLVTFCHRSTEESKSVPGNILSMYCAHHSSSVALALGITLVYWVFIFDPEVSKLTVGKIASHGVNSLVMLIDLMLVAHPVILSDIAYPLGFALIYSLFTIVYYMCGGTNAEGGLYVYKILDWSQPLNALFFTIIGMCILSFMFVLVWLLAAVRTKIAARLKPTWVIIHV